MLMKQTIFRLLLAVVVLSPLPFASNRPWSWSLLAVLVGLLLATWSVASLFDGTSRGVGLRRIWPVLGLFCLAAGWSVLPTVPFTPWEWQHPLWNDLDVVLERGMAPKVTLDAYETRTALMRLLSYAGVFWLSLQYCRSADRARQVFHALSVAGLAYAAYGLIVHFAGLETILWFDKWAYRGHLTSTFVNRNSYATYAGLGLLCSVGLIVQIVTGNIRGGFSARQAARAILETLAGRGWLLIAAAFTIATALLLTHSRGGFLGSALGLVALLFAAGLSRPLRSRAMWGAGAVVALVGIAIFSLSGEVTDVRLARTSLDTEIRDEFNVITMRGIESTPGFGTGYGTFESAFRMYRDSSLPFSFSRTVAKAHNTYLENALELGIPAAAALIGAIAGLGFICLLGIRRRRRNVMFPIIGLAATVLVGAHSLVDFSLQIPAVAVTYAMIMGAACAQSWPSSGWRRGG
ncbi:MAG: O-antigen ligase family protein [Proteobacteria bacterium]|nr:O-antigen ligase family protein [Pseudomonadota bacterium]